MTTAAKMMALGIPAEQAKAIAGDAETGVTATGSGQSDAYSLRAAITEITGGAATTGVVLPAATPGDSLIVLNNSGLEKYVYPPTNGTINGGIADTGVHVWAGMAAICFALTNDDYAVILGNIPVDLTYAKTSAEKTPPFALGSKAVGTAGSVYMFVHCGSALSQYQCVAIDEDFSAFPATAALATGGHTPGFPQQDFAVNDYGWVPIESHGGHTLLVASSCAADVPLYTDVSTAGTLDDSATATQVAVLGVRIVTTMASTTGQSEFIAVSPQFVDVGSI